MDAHSVSSQSARIPNTISREATEDAVTAGVIILGFALVSLFVVWMREGTSGLERSGWSMFIFVIAALGASLASLLGSYLRSPVEIELTPSALILHFRLGGSQTTSWDQIRRLILRRRYGGTRHVYLRVVWTEPQDPPRTRSKSMMIGSSIGAILRSRVPGGISVEAK
jgi:hypothetical protein